MIMIRIPRINREEGIMSRREDGTEEPEESASAKWLEWDRDAGDCWSSSSPSSSSSLSSSSTRMAGCWLFNCPPVLLLAPPVVPPPSSNLVIPLCLLLC